MPKWAFQKIDLNDLPRRSSDIDILNNAGRELTDARREASCS
jgi:hypothetical protein